MIRSTGSLAPKPYRTLRISLVLLTLALLLAPSSGAGAINNATLSAAADAFAHPEFEKVWSRTDGPVASGAVSRSWLWGPAPGSALNESFAQGVDGARSVQYFDKARMELNPAVTDPASPWRVTTGLLVSEMVQGRVQTGDKQAVALPPPTEVLAGDSGSAGPRYSDFGKAQTARSGDRTGSPVTDTLSMRPGLAAAPGPAKYAYYSPETGHNIPDVFLSYMNASGQVQDAAGRPVVERVFDWVYLMGYPITEAYWTQIKVDGAPQTALVQLFQRRTVTYVPGMPEGWRVQMGNVGQHYFMWRYGVKGMVQQPSQPPRPTATPAPGFPGNGTFVGISGDNFMYAGTEIKIKGTNYWLHSQPFVSTWAEWDGPVALAELQKARDMGANAIRIGLPFDHRDTMDVVWNSDRTMSKVSPWIIDEMTQLLQIASIHGMKVIFVLFEWHDDYPDEWSKQAKSHTAYLEGIIKAFAEDDRVLAWDLHNEPDHYGEWKGGKQDRVIKWLQRTAATVRQLDRRHPITVGVGDYRSLWYPANDGTTIPSMVDFVAFHSYDAFGVRQQIEEIKRRTRKPVLLEEMGWPTSPGEYPQPNNATYDESTQNLLYRTMLAAARETDIAGVMQWTLYDYRPRSSTHEKPSGFEENFGLVRTDGSLKPAAGIFKDDYSGRILPSDTKSYRPLTPAGEKNK